MSDLKHRTTQQLRDEIKRTTEFQQKLRQEADDADAKARAMEAEAAMIRREADRKRRRAHNSAQRTTWARYYLAKKEIAEATGLPSSSR